MATFEQAQRAYDAQLPPEDPNDDWGEYLESMDDEELELLGNQLNDDDEWISEDPTWIAEMEARGLI